MKNKYDAMVAGHVCLDITPRFTNARAASIDRILTPGKVVNVGACEISTGGAVSNTGYALYKSGHRVCLSALVGTDLFGEKVTGLLGQAGNIKGIRAVPQQSTSYSIVLAPPNIDRIFLHHPGANDFFTSEDLDVELLRNCRHFHFGYPPLMRQMYRHKGADLKCVFQIAKKAGCITSCDMSLPDPDSESGKAPWLDILADFLPYVDIFLPSAEEAFFLLKKDDFLYLNSKNSARPVADQLTTENVQELAGKLLDMGTGIVVLKCGKRGIYLKSGACAQFSPDTFQNTVFHDQWANREIWCPAFMIDSLASATGAGDAAIAGFLAAFIRNLPPTQCLKVACALGWENLHSYDAVSSIRSYPETLKLIKDRLIVDEQSLKTAGWVWDRKQGVWLTDQDSLNRK